MQGKKRFNIAIAIIALMVVGLVVIRCSEDDSLFSKVNSTQHDSASNEALLGDKASLEKSNSLGDPNIRYEVEFGECVGYCRHSISIIGDVAALTSIANDGSPEKVQKKTLDAETLDKIRSESARVSSGNVEYYNSCPDCSDGGLSRLVVNSERIEWKYGESPNELQALSTLLDGLFDLTE